MWPFTRRKEAQKQKKLVPVTATDADIAWAKQLIGQGFEPSLRRNLETLNQALSRKGIRAGIEVTWYFDKLEEEKEK